jgi:hypothetical protein
LLLSKGWETSSPPTPQDDSESGERLLRLFLNFIFSHDVLGGKILATRMKGKKRIRKFREKPPPLQIHLMNISYMKQWMEITYGRKNTVVT